MAHPSYDDIAAAAVSALEELGRSGYIREIAGIAGQRLGTGEDGEAAFLADLGDALRMLEAEGTVEAQDTGVLGAGPLWILR